MEGIEQIETLWGKDPEELMGRIVRVKSITSDPDEERAFHGVMRDEHGDYYAVVGQAARLEMVHPSRIDPEPVDGLVEALEAFEKAAQRLQAFKTVRELGTAAAQSPKASEGLLAALRALMAEHG